MNCEPIRRTGCPGAIGKRWPRPVPPLPADHRPSAPLSPPASEGFTRLPEAHSAARACSRSAPPARMAATSEKRSSGVKMDGSSKDRMGLLLGPLSLLERVRVRACPQRPSLGDRRTVWHDTGINSLYLLTYPVRSRSDERVVRKRLANWPHRYAILPLITCDTERIAERKSSPVRGESRRSTPSTICDTSTCLYSMTSRNWWEPVVISAAQPRY